MVFIGFDCFVKFLKRPNKPLHHSHFVYQLLFNNVFVEQKDCNCSIEHQSSTFLNQKSQANFANKTEQLIYYGEEMCIYGLTTTTSHRPSEATAKREFNVIEATVNTLLGPSAAIPKVYIESEKITEIFTAEVISYTSYNSIIEQIKSKFDSMIIQLVQSNWLHP